jgi:hypothetical protein
VNDKKECHNLFFIANLLLAIVQANRLPSSQRLDRPKRKEREPAMMTVLAVCRKVKGENFNDIP